MKISRFSNQSVSHPNEKDLSVIFKVQVQGSPEVLYLFLLGGVGRRRGGVYVL